jgi:hypothetical protein
MLVVADAELFPPTSKINLIGAAGGNNNSLPLQAPDTD